ncbi:WYL domain-containing protein [Deinococcus sp. YIM 134068]|uniref:WYL domain-containing protein n=1 Tax=Deinococcus lichenicola TaxID=3118910 RepID=UPI002F91D3B6
MDGEGGRAGTGPGTFDPGGFLRPVRGGGGDGSARTVHLRFRHDAARRILLAGHIGLSEPYLNPDGTIDTTVDAPADADGLPRGLLPWLLGWGPRVQVLGPPEVRQLWQREVRAAAEAAEVEPLRFPEGGAA